MADDKIRTVGDLVKELSQYPSETLIEAWDGFYDKIPIVVWDSREWDDGGLPPPDWQPTICIVVDKDNRVTRL